MLNNKKILAADYDWTFWRREEEDLAHNLSAVSQWRDKGNLFTFSTGRDVASMMFEKKVRNIDWDYMIALNGSFIVDKNNNVIFKKALNKELAIELVNLIKEEFGDELIISSGFDGCNFTNKKKSENDEHSKEVFERNSKIYSKTIEAALEDEVLLVGCLADSVEHAKTFKEKVLNKYSDCVDVFINIHYINIVPKGISKASALDLLIEYTNVKEENVSVIGDDLNDIPMLLKYNGYSVPNARQEAKEAATKIYNSVSDLIKDKI